AGRVVQVGVADPAEREHARGQVHGRVRRAVAPFDQDGVGIARIGVGERTGEAEAVALVERGGAGGETQAAGEGIDVGQCNVVTVTTAVADLPDAQPGLEGAALGQVGEGAIDGVVSPVVDDGELVAWLRGETVDEGDLQGAGEVDVAVDNDL